MPSVSRLRVLAAAGAAALVLCTSCALPLASESEVEDQGDKEFQKIKAGTPVSTNARAQAYVNCVANAIIRELEEPYASKRWEIEVFDSEEINAFALPGGHIGVYSGIFKVAETPSQLATVIGHEVAHVTRKHALQRYNREMTTQAGIIGATVALGGGSLTANALGAAAQLGLSLPFSRANESEADLVGLDYMAAAGFNPTQAVPLWENMEKKAKGGPPQFLSTHPSPDTRIQDLVKRYPEALQRYNKAQAAGKQPRCQRD
jgi:predicted Zn-dependent protease